MEKLTIGPNDILIMRIAPSVSEDRIRAIRTEIEYHLGKDIAKRLMIVDQAVSFAVIAPTN